ncbi:hypothetical protein HNQ92_004314 [Rhabdobacter roseus]|uniref:Uncharacterized protein n=1 Tax=Rhabdobacter roseus TaxID=1655419 RepID=A0A840TS73_9BACT|nr:hypothetical protein [Rhabdobacter roseus]
MSSEYKIVFPNQCHRHDMFIAKTAIQTDRVETVN